MESALTITVTDADVNTDAGVVESVSATVTNDISGEFEQIVLTETGPNTGVFSARHCQLPPGAPGTNNDGTLNASDGDAVTATYTDQLDAAGDMTVRSDTGGLGTDSDGDNVVNGIDLDDDNDGIPDASEAAGDFDSDGLANSLDIDSDNDGIPDNVEAQAESASYVAPTGLDTDDDGLDNAYDSDNGGTAITIANTDLAGNPDYIENDS